MRNTFVGPSRQENLLSTFTTKGKGGDYFICFYRLQKDTEVTCQELAGSMLSYGGLYLIRSPVTGHLPIVPSSNFHGFIPDYYYYYRSFLKD
jgi:hypothetical protein